MEVGIDLSKLLLLRRVAPERLGTRYPYNRLVGGNDNRGIDVGLLSKLEPMSMWTLLEAGGTWKAYESPTSRWTRKPSYRS